jgi:hypothetical protein
MDAVEQKADARLELGRRALERRVGLGVAARLGGRIGDAPVDDVRLAREVGTDLANPNPRRRDYINVSLCNSRAFAGARRTRRGPADVAERWRAMRSRHQWKLSFGIRVSVV